MYHHERETESPSDAIYLILTCGFAGRASKVPAKLQVRDIGFNSFSESFV